jgi:glycosyltransferase involved in cell wall biosynthesis
VTEIVVVDNGSRDATKSVVDEFSLASPIRVLYVFEERQGLCFARNRGIQEASGNVIAFTDDDCIADSQWIANIAKEFIADPNVAVIGGRVDLYSKDDEPVTIRPLDERVRYTGVHHAFSLIIGCNMAFRRNLFKEIGGFDPAFGGSRGVTADDIEIIYRAVRRGFLVIFVPEVRVRHDHGRRTEVDLCVLNRSYRKGRGAFYCKNLLKGDPDVFRQAYWEVVQDIRSITRGSRTKRGAPNGSGLRDLLAGALHLIMVRARLVRP